MHYFILVVLDLCYLMYMYLYFNCWKLCFPFLTNQVLNKVIIFIIGRGECGKTGCPAKFATNDARSSIVWCITMTPVSCQVIIVLVALTRDCGLLNNNNWWVVAVIDATYNYGTDGPAFKNNFYSILMIINHYRLFKCVQYMFYFLCPTLLRSYKKFCSSLTRKVPNFGLLLRLNGSLVWEVSVSAHIRKITISSLGLEAYWTNWYRRLGSRRSHRLSLILV